MLQRKHREGRRPSKKVVYEYIEPQYIVVEMERRKVELGNARREGGKVISKAI